MMLPVSESGPMMHSAAGKNPREKHSDAAIATVRVMANCEKAKEQRKGGGRRMWRGDLRTGHNNLDGLNSRHSNAQSRVQDGKS